MKKYRRKFWTTLICLVTVMIATNIATYSLKDNKVSAVEKVIEEVVSQKNSDVVKKTKKKNINKNKTNKKTVEMYRKNGKKYCVVTVKKSKIKS